MFNQDFYPTPDNVTHRMMGMLKRQKIGWAFPYKAILDPSAGKGDILRVVGQDVGCMVHERGKTICRENQQILYAIEIEPELQDILRGMKIPVIDEDFLGYGGSEYFDLILMNPPFSVGAAHLLKAWDVVADGGEIVCLLNAETIHNPYSGDRKVLANLIEQHGRVETIGTPFKTAERRTGVEVAMVHLAKPKKERSTTFNFAVDVDAPMSEEAYTANPLAHRDIIASLVAQYKAAEAHIIELAKHQEQVRFYMQGMIQYKKIDVLEGDINSHLRRIKGIFWDYLFEKTKLAEVSTTSFRYDFYEFQKQYGHMAFNEKNILNVLSMFYDNRQGIMERAIGEVFDAFTRYYKGNRHHPEGWKTNSQWQMKKKVILPNTTGVLFGGFGWYTSYGKSRETIHDLDVAVGYLVGKPLDQMMTLKKHIEEVGFHDGAGVLHETDYFTYRLYGKGTIHITWKDEALLAQFNQIACSGKNWLGTG